MAIEIFGDDKQVTQCETLNGKKVMLVGYGFEEIGKKWSIYSAKTNRYINTVITKEIATIKKANGAIYVAD